MVVGVGTGDGVVGREGGGGCVLVCVKGGEGEIKILRLCWSVPSQCRDKVGA